MCRSHVKVEIAIQPGIWDSDVKQTERCSPGLHPRRNRAYLGSVDHQVGPTPRCHYTLAPRPGPGQGDDSVQDCRPFIDMERTRLNGAATSGLAIKRVVTMHSLPHFCASLELQ